MAIMSKKIDKLREINEQLTSMLIQLEAHVFVESGKCIQLSKSKKDVSKAIPQPK